MANSDETFTVNERCLCYHGPLIYEAKVLKVRNNTEPTEDEELSGIGYFVHYKGWKQSWDEWLGPERLLKFNDANVAKQKLLVQQTQAASSSSKSKGKESASVAGTARTAQRKEGGRGTKRQREEDGAGDATRVTLKLDTPEILKVKLVDDWENITKNQQLLTFPRSPTVSQLLSEFEKHVREVNPGSIPDAEKLMPTITSGIVTYFDKALGANLLYKNERPQYLEVRKSYFTGHDIEISEQKQASAVYGAEHLLRMLVALPKMVASAGLDQESVTLVKAYVEELMRYMVQERERMFQKEYVAASVQYNASVRS